MKPNSTIEEQFYAKYGSLDQDAIIKLNELYGTGELNNVVTGLRSHCYGVFLMDDSSEIVYRLLYVNGTKQLEGDILELTAHHPERDQLVFFFSNFISHNYKNVDAIDTFNTFQEQTRTMLEKIGYLTVDSVDFREHNDSNPAIIAKNVKGILNVPRIDKVSFYKEFFGNKLLHEIKKEQDFIYLMLNQRNNLIKIGKSKNPIFRERTLQSQEPEITLLTFWEAPKRVEKELHRKFIDKKQRGEWFELSLKELKVIKELMEVYEKL